MALSGSQPAIVEARSGVEQSGNSRCGFFYPWPIIKIGGVDVTRYVDLSTLEITDRLNAEPNDCAFTIRRRAGLSVTEGQAVIVALGNDQPSLREFAGYITRLVQRWDEGQLFYEVSAEDATRILNKYALTSVYKGWSATDIIKDIANVPGITALHVEPGLPVLDLVLFENAKRSDALTEVLGRADIQGDWYLEPSTPPDLHAFRDESQWYADPPAISNTSVPGYITSLRIDSEETQRRTRVIVYGASATCPIAIPANTLFPINYSGGTGQINTLPLTGADRIDGIGTVRLRYVTTSTTISVNEGTVAPALVATLSADAAVGAATLSISSTTGLPTRGWVNVGGEIVYYDTLGGAGILATIPPSGIGSVRTPIQAGVTVTPLSQMTVAGGTLFSVEIESGADVTLRTIANDLAAQAAVAAIDGSDGIYEWVIDDDTLSAAQAAARASAELAAFSGQLRRLQYTTRHRGHRSGRRVSVALSGSLGSLSDLLMIQEVRVSGFDEVTAINGRKVTAFPRRECTAAPLRLKNASDLLAKG